MLRRIILAGVGTLAVLLYGLMSAAKKADNANDDLYERILPKGDSDVRRLQRHKKQD